MLKAVASFGLSRLFILAIMDWMIRSYGVQQTCQFGGTSLLDSLEHVLPGLEQITRALQ